MNHACCRTRIACGAAARITIAAACIIIVGTGCAHAQRTAPAQAVTLLDYKAPPPAGWETRSPASTSRLAEFVMRNAAARDSVELIVYYFGASQGGGVDANVARWTAQFNGPGRAEVKPRVTTLKDTRFKTTEVELEGAYARAIGMGDPANAIPGQSLLASIVETPRGNLYVQMFGPIARVRAQHKAYLDFVTRIR